MQPPEPHAPPRPPALRVMAAATAGEREILEAFLDFHRDVVVHKARGVGDADARRRLLPSRTTLAGLLRHLTVVEQTWFHPLAAAPAPQTAPAGNAAAAEEDTSWDIAEATTLDSLLADYDDACAHSREASAAFALDDVLSHPEIGQVSLRWIYVHVIEETARHAGHADVIRELTDGAVGVLA
ncbi:DinB family protein [Frankia canadensis]|nr:DinB family protein [Frankia canadensis]